jgi:hypothetical protein
MTADVGFALVVIGICCLMFYFDMRLDKRLRAEAERITREIETNRLIRERSTYIRQYEAYRVAVERAAERAVETGTRRRHAVKEKVN